MGIDPEEEDEQVSEEEIRMMLAAGNEQGTIDAEENEMIQNVFEFDDITAGQICTHRIDVISLDVTDTAEDWRRSSTNRDILCTRSATAVWMT